MEMTPKQCPEESREQGGRASCIKAQKGGGSTGSVPT